MRLINPATPTSSITVSDGRTLLVRNLAMDLPATSPPGGGLATTLTVPLELGGLAPGSSVHFALTFAVDTLGSFWIGYDVDALGGSAMPSAAKTATAAKGSKATARQKALDARRLADSKKLSVISGTLR